MKNQNHFFAVIVIAVFGVCFTSLAHASSCYVSHSTGGTTHATVQKAIDDPKCTVIYLGKKTFTGNFIINREVTIEGENQNLTNLDGGLKGSVITLEDPTTYSRPVVTLKNLTIQNGSSTNGGGISKDECDAMVVLDNVTMKNNKAQENGGAIYNSNSTSYSVLVRDITITNSLIKGNSAGNDGGGIYTLSNVLIEKTSVIKNTADRAGGIIGGPLSMLEILTSTIGENVAVEAGGIHMQGDASIFNSTIYGNSSSKAGYAGGIDSKSADSLGIYDTVVGKNSGGDCNIPAAIVTSFGGNMDTDNTCSLSGFGDYSGIIDPGLVATTGNVYIAKSNTSPVVDKGLNDYCDAVDQKGNSRPQDGNIDGTADCDIGAMERTGQLKLPAIINQPSPKLNTGN